VKKPSGRVEVLVKGTMGDPQGKSAWSTSAELPLGGADWRVIPPQYQVGFSTFLLFDISSFVIYSL